MYKVVNPYLGGEEGRRREGGGRSEGSKKEEKETESHSQSRFFVCVTCYPPSTEPVVTAFKTSTFTITSPKLSLQMMVLAL